MRTTAGRLLDDDEACIVPRQQADGTKTHCPCFPVLQAAGEASFAPMTITSSPMTTSTSILGMNPHVGHRENGPHSIQHSISCINHVQIQPEEISMGTHSHNCSVSSLGTRGEVTREQLVAIKGVELSWHEFKLAKSTEQLWCHSNVTCFASWWR